MSERTRFRRRFFARPMAGDDDESRESYGDKKRELFGEIGGRVLKPEGRFVSIEHVVAPPGSRRIGQRVCPHTPWRYFSDGCDPGREAGAAIRRAGFSGVGEAVE